MRQQTSSESSAGNAAQAQPGVSAKVVLIGPTGVGKTSILMRHNGQGFATKTSPTIGACFSNSVIHCGDAGTVNFQVWDTAGEERFRAMAPMYYRNAVGALGVLDVTKEESVEGVRRFVTDLRDHAVGIQPVIVIVANKVDRERERVVGGERVEGLAESLSVSGWVETSALTGAGVERAFRTLARAVLEQRAEWASQGFPLPLEDPKPPSPTPKACAC